MRCNEDTFRHFALLANANHALGEVYNALNYVSSCPWNINHKVWWALAIHVWNVICDAISILHVSFELVVSCSVMSVIICMMYQKSTCYIHKVSYTIDAVMMVYRRCTAGFGHCRWVEQDRLGVQGSADSFFRNYHSRLACRWNVCFVVYLYLNMLWYSSCAKKGLIRRLIFGEWCVFIYLQQFHLQLGIMK